MADFSVKAILNRYSYSSPKSGKAPISRHMKCHRNIYGLHLSRTRVTGSILDELGINIKRFWRMEGKCVVFLQQNLPRILISQLLTKLCR